MKNLIIIISLLIGTLSFSQKKDFFDEKNNEKIRTAKIAYITNELELTPKEAEKFWPIFNEFDKKIHALRKSSRKSIKTVMFEKGGIDNLSDNEASNLINKIEQNRKKMYALELEYSSKLKEILPVKKILKLHKAKKDFHKKLLHKLKEKK